MSESDNSEKKSQDSSPETTENHSSNIESQLALIEELEHKLKLLRWGLFVGVLAVMVLGISSIWNTTKKAAEPAVEVYKEAKATYEGIEGKINDAQQIYTKMAPEAEKAYSTISALIKSDGASDELQSEFKEQYETRIKPAAEDLAKHILVDLQAEAMEKFSEVSTESDAIMLRAREELHTLTNSIPDMVTKAINNTLVETINSREEKMREMFPKLTKEKQVAVASRLSNLSDEQAEKIFLALFHEHVSELGQISDSLEQIAAKETAGANAGGLTGDVQSNLALLSAVLSLVKKEYDTEVKPITPKGSEDNE